MSNEFYSQKVLELSLYIKEKLRIKHEIFSICDVDIAFFEEIFKYLFPSYESCNENPSERFETMTCWLSNFLNIPIGHIDVQSLVSYDPLSLYNLLEILNLCVDDVPGCTVIDGSNDEETTISDLSNSIYKENIDAHLEETRLKYLQCKLAEMLLIKDRDETIPAPIELMSCQSSRRLSPRVKFAEEPCVIAASLTTRTPRSTGSLLRPIDRPLSQGSRRNAFPLSTFSANAQRRVRRSYSAPYAQFTHSEAETIFEELMRQLSVLELSRETQNYIKIRLQSCMTTGRSSSSSRNPVEQRLTEMAARQERRIQLAERTEEETSRIRALRDSRGFENLLRAEMHQRKRQSVFDRYLNIRQEERLQSYAKARKIEEERIVRRAFDAALDKARQYRIEENNLMREVRQKELELQNTLLSNLEYRYEERVQFLKDEQNKRQTEFELKAKTNKMENLQEKMELRRQLTKQIKELEEALLNQIKS
ncbi:hypothetical protein Aperf_G00000013930 [Anoplocephala perfoliata]